MGNEAKTENIVRNRLRELGYYDDTDIIVEEKKSDNPVIDKLLKNASKKGSGAGYPEFIIRSNQFSDFLIVIECKADILKHASKELNHYAEYAVDGALLYSTYLAKEYDVLAIGVSGEEISAMKVSHYLLLKGTNEKVPFLGNQILPFADYYTEYSKNPNKFNQDYQKLLNYSRELNEILHASKIKESLRSLLISGILISLKNAAFRISYKKHKNAKQLSHNIVETIANELSSANLPEAKITNLKQAFHFITTHTKLSRNKEFLENLITEIDDNINSFLRTHQYFDAIGQFYIEFLRYANNDKALGIVLTPPHITQLFADLAEVNKDSIVIDNCCGTGGFLISSMQKMNEDAKGNQQKILDIRKRQIIGIEFQDDIFALAISNMIIHDDGKSNIYQGDCLVLKDEIKNQYKPNVGMLNPPYKTEKSDAEELDFVLNNLEMLSPNGKCIAIIPMRCAIAQSGKSLEPKKTLLGKHTLEAVMSMPNELFHNSGVGVVTCALVITAHNPHPLDKKTWFGYWKNDGFVKVRKKGRIDKTDNWDSIRKVWVTSFTNREVVPGMSVMAEVKADDEWCVEAFMETDYGRLTQEDFAKEIKKYVAFSVSKSKQ